MTSPRLDNYLLTCRKAAGLSQDEVAFLLGGISGTKVSRYERRTRVPQLDTALAYEAVFGTPVQELFAGRFQKVESTIGIRVQRLVRKLESRRCDRLTGRKLETLRAIAAGTTTRRSRRV